MLCKDLGCGDKVDNCDGCGKKFKPNSHVRPIRELNAVFCDNDKCVDRFIKMNSINNMDKWIPVSWEMEKEFNDFHNLSKIKIDAMNSPFYKEVRYAVRRSGMVLNIKGKWEYEPIPSSRDDAFYKRCRFKSIEDAEAAVMRCQK